METRRMTRIARLLCLLLALAATPALAKRSLDFSTTDYAQVELGVDRQVSAPGDAAQLVLRIDPQPGWHTYWLNPGGPGAATMIEWEAPAGVEISEIIWPTPERLPFGPFVNYGYEGETLLVARLSVSEDWPAGQPIDLVARANWLLCKDICIGEAKDFHLSLPTASTPEVDPEIALSVERAEGRRAREVGLVGEYEADAERVRLVFAAETLGGVALEDGYFYAENHGVVESAAEQTVAQAGDRIIVELQRPSADGFGGSAMLTGELVGIFAPNDAVGGEGAIRLTASGVDETAAGVAPAGSIGEGGADGAERAALASAEGAAASSGTMPASLWEAAIGAFLGGLILNVMPCVFPVLALKAMSFVAGAQAARRERLTHAGLYTAGVLATFLAIAAALILLKAAGGGERWGFQMQSPWVVGGLAALMLIIGLNFSGVFEFSSRYAGVGSSLAARGGGAGAFFTGMLAVIVASPCTAPFMIGALGFAATQDAATALIVFAALGLGFAAPLALLGLWPALARRLPKPGPWMTRMRQILAFPMYATVAYLLWVLGGLAGRDAILAGMVALVLIAAALWAIGVGAPGSRSGRRIASVAAIVCAVLALLTFGAGVRVGSQALATGGAEAEAALSHASPFDPDAVAAARAAGHTVFVNVTADWCISCKFNEVNVLTADSVQAAVAREDIVYFIADWTRYDPTITAYLDSFNHPGAPLYVVYPADGAPVVLPQLLTEAVVLEALGVDG